MRRVRGFIAAAALFCLAGGAFAQSDNYIQFPGDSMEFLQFYAKLDTLLQSGEGHINILHIGGSHIQAGIWSQQMRRNLLLMEGGPDGTPEEHLDGGRGLIFPFSIAKTNNPESFRTRYTGKWSVCKSTRPEPAKALGLTGMAVSTRDTAASVTLLMQEKRPHDRAPHFTFDKIRLLGEYDGNPMDSLIVLDTPTDSITLFFRDFKHEITLNGILLDNERPGISYHGIGVNGAGLVAYSRCENLARDLELVKPDLVIFSIGINDASGRNFNEELFIERYDALIAQVKSVSPDCAMLFTTNNDSFRRVKRGVYAVNQNGPLVERAFLKLGKKHDAGVWNLFHIMGGLNSMKRWEKEGLAKRDKIHFTDVGYEIIGDWMFDALMKGFENYKSSER